MSWDDAVAFCEWLNDSKAGSAPDPKAGSAPDARAGDAGEPPGRWRLPTDFEWEFAMRGGRSADSPTPWGDAVPEGEIPDGPLEGPWDTGRGTPNGYGVLDPGTMVHEWCLNWSGEAPPGGGPRRRASKGGSWRHAIRWSAPSASSSLPPGLRYADYGFRVLFAPDGFRVLFAPDGLQVPREAPVGPRPVVQ